jgi:hypothetical protein
LHEPDEKYLVMRVTGSVMGIWQLFGQVFGLAAHLPAKQREDRHCPGPEEQGAPTCLSVDAVDAATQGALLAPAAPM